MRLDLLSASDIEVVGSALRAAVDGPFFEDWEFHTLMGVERDEMRRISSEWPRQTVDDDTFAVAVLNSLTNLRGYPHKLDAELEAAIPGGKSALVAVHDRLIEVQA